MSNNAEDIHIGDIDRPFWIDKASTETLSEVEAIVHGGCASGAYMPAVTYHQASETMSKYGDDVLQYIEDNLGELPSVPQDVSWSGLAVYFLSYGVELWASSILVEYEASTSGSEPQAEAETTSTNINEDVIGVPI